MTCVAINSTVTVFSRMNYGIPFGFSRDEASSFTSVMVDGDNTLFCRSFVSISVPGESIRGEPAVDKSSRHQCLVFVFMITSPSGVAGDANVTHIVHGQRMSTTSIFSVDADGRVVFIK